MLVLNQGASSLRSAGVGHWLCRHGDTVMLRLRTRRIPASGVSSWRSGRDIPAGTKSCIQNILPLVATQRRAQHCRRKLREQLLRTCLHRGVPACSVPTDLHRGRVPKIHMDASKIR